MKKKILTFTSCICVVTLICVAIFTSTHFQNVMANESERTDVNYIEASMTDKDNTVLYKSNDNVGVIENTKNIEKENHENDYSYTESLEIFENSLEECDTDVITELNKQIASYQSMLSDKLTKEDSEKINGLINTTRSLLSSYINYKNGIAPTGVAHPIYSPIVAAAIGVFLAHNYALSAELLTHATETAPNSTYIPVRYGRVLSSQLTYDFAYGQATRAPVAFERDGGSPHEKDLYYSLHGGTFTKPSSDSRVVTFEDIYDYDPGKFEGIVGIVVDQMAAAQNLGVIVPYTVKFSIDVSAFLRLKVVGSDGLGTIIQITNPTNKDIEVVYNDMLVTEGNARGWSNFNKIKTIHISANSSANVNVKLSLSMTENITCLPFSYVLNNCRYITYVSNNLVAHDKNLADEKYAIIY